MGSVSIGRIEVAERMVDWWTSLTAKRNWGQLRWKRGGKKNIEIWLTNGVHPQKVDTKLRNKKKWEGGCKMKRRRTYTRDFKISVIREVVMGKTLAQVSRENEIHPSLVVKWKKEYFRGPGKCHSWQRGDIKSKQGWQSLKGWLGSYTQKTSF